MADQRQQLRARLRNAERRLAEAEREQINTASAQYSGYAGTDQGHDTSFRELNRRIASAAGVDELRAEVARLREVLGEEERVAPWARLRAWLGRA